MLYLAKYIISKDCNIIKDINNLEFEDEIKDLILQILKRESTISPFPYHSDIPKSLLDLTNIVDGWLDLCEGNILYQVSKAISTQDSDGLIVVEIGAFLGRSTIFLAQGLKESGKGILISIDPHEGIPYYHPAPTYNDYLENIKTAKLEECIQIEKGISENVITKINQPIYLLFIDGDHTYDMVKKDFSLYNEKVIDGGYIAFHDAVLEGPFKVINEVVSSNRWEFLQMIGNLALLRKNTSLEREKDNLTILNLILLHINRKFHLNFMENDRNSLKKEVLVLLQELFS